MRQAPMAESDDETRQEKRMRMTRLRGYEFFRAIGSPQRVVAPMVDQSELAFRMLTRRHGAELCYTPMFHSRLFAESAEYRAKMFEKHIKDRPLIVQFCGNDPQTVLAAARHVEGHCDAVDLNLGCPQGIARKGRYGSFLMKEKDTVRDIVTTLSQNLSIPVTVKIRIFPDRQETLEFADMIQAAGADLLCVHGRTKEMNKTAVKEADWDIIREIKERLSIPVIANGGIELPEDVERCLQVTKADGVMSSEAILENPALFSTDKEASYSFVEMAKQYLDATLEYPPASDKIIRAHLFKIIFQDLCVHTDLRTDLAKAPNRDAMVKIVEELEKRLAEKPGEYKVETSWYRRHRRSQEKLLQREKQHQEAVAREETAAVA
ncbi:hypothetical protein Poli38472_004337 [Pythium oligandrum]|uniref:tRNA-dihydrouridine(16/17) synthase [NAD(P)(+)] n=1 Tax=Pythium oligandrum TaxID=41045 RepID=A0A8K1CA77_PYTOL|nr:hypothetical protein Poli38472_004337 [Pythium oligandrum]|eukprot:TMW59268.1 hypothetical protein Poli38472_004337 [Pythium oligandrum]